MRTCTQGECTRPHRAKGLCAYHYGVAYGYSKDKRTRYTITCATCGLPHQSSRPDGKYCSDVCKGKQYSVRMQTKCMLPDDHPVMQAIELHRALNAKPIVWCVYFKTCGVCASLFTTRHAGVVTCSDVCAQAKRSVVRSEHRARRKARQYAGGGSYTWTEVMHLFIRHDRCCAYCERPVTGQPEPDHVLALARGGRNSITNILPACRTCNHDKSDMTLDEWATSRQTRGLEPVTTTWTADDLRVRHLVIDAPTVDRWNDRHAA